MIAADVVVNDCSTGVRDGMSRAGGSLEQRPRNGKRKS